MILIPHIYKGESKSFESVGRNSSTSIDQKTSYIRKITFILEANCVYVGLGEDEQIIHVKKSTLLDG